ncbi:MAG TPA: right-handed parallel beta-helix repeat-containing protein [Gemmatimonadaceae bacterium]
MQHSLSLSLVRGHRGRGRTFYVDATGGSDANDGRSTGAAWQTLAKVNAATLLPGDSVLLKRGGVWTGTRLVLAASGVAGAPITVGAYGSGAKPVIDGGTVFSPYAAGVDCILISGSQSYVTIENLELRNGNDFGISMAGCGNIVVADCDIHDFGNDGILVFSGSHDVTILRGTYANAKNRTGTYVSSGIEIGDGGQNFLIDGAECYGNATCGIACHNHSAADPQGRTDVPRYVTIRNVYSHDNTGSGAQILTGDTTNNPFDMTIEDSRFASNGTYDLNLTKTAASTVFPTNVTVRRCTLQNGVGAGSVQVQVQGTGHRVYRNLLQLSADKQVNLSSCTDLEFAHNTIYQAANTTAAAMVVVGSPASSVRLRDNLWLAGSTGAFLLGVATGAGAGVTADYNFYDTAAAPSGLRWTWNGTNVTYANWQATSGQDAHSTAFQRAQVVAVGSDFHLQAGSPCIDAGVAIAGINDDYLGAAPDLGYAEKA